MSKNKEDKKEKPPAQINIREFGDVEKPIRRTFPGPRGAVDIVRVAIERNAYAELVAHAKSSLAAEVCGVLAGRMCQDDEGVFVHVEAVIPGTAASEASTHVTFTQETWNAIHAVLEHDFPKLKIVGWYHTHPGFGVEFSEMDVFIQKNFFAGPSQIALVTDPLNGDVAICVNRQDGIEYLQHFWIEGREQQCRTPRRASDHSSNAGSSGNNESESNTVSALEARVGQLVQSLDEMRNFHYRFMMFCGAVFCMTLIGVGAYTIYSQWVSRLEPPKPFQFAEIPIQIGDKEVLMGIALASWKVPPELNSLMLQAELLKRMAEEKEAKAKADAANQDNTNHAASANTNIPAGLPNK
jgi:proteasome lid subunit RPN8/RPN11